MGKTKTKFIDDSSLVEEVKKSAPKKQNQDDSFGGTQDKLVEKLKAELGMTDEVKPDETKVARGDTEESTRREAAGAKAIEDARRDTEVAGPRAQKKPGKEKPRSKKYKEISKDLDRDKVYSLTEAVDLTKKLSYSKFDGTLEAHINTIQTIRGLVSLPFVSGKKLRILAFGSSETKKIDEVTYGDDSSIESIMKGKIDFDLVIATPIWMPKLAKTAKFLGPRGLMPNPKNGTIAQSEEGLKKAIASFQEGKTEYKTESKSPVIHLGLGKLSQPSEELVANVKLLLSTIGKTKIKKVSLSPTMGPSVKVDLASL